MSNNNENNTSGFDRFRDRHPVLLNSVLMVLALVALGYIALLFIDVFTSHGQQVQVPDVRNMPLEKAIDIIEDAGLHWEINDSTTFDEKYKPGTVMDQDPKPKSYIKKIRTIYLNVNAMHARLVKLPKLIDMPGRQGLATLKAMGFKNVTVDSIPSEMLGLILQVTVDGHNVAQGASASVNSNIKIIVGDGSIVDLNPEELFDQQTRDSLAEIQYRQDSIEYEIKMKEYREEMERQRQEEQAEQDRKDNKKDESKKDKDKNKDQQSKNKDSKSKDNKDKKH